MVPPTRTVQQQSRHKVDGAPAFHLSPFYPLTTPQMQALLASSPSHGSSRLVYTVLLIHADCLGQVTAQIADVAHAANLAIETTRHILRQLRETGEIVSVRQGYGRRKATWRLGAFQPAPHAA